MFESWLASSDNVRPLFESGKPAELIWLGDECGIITTKDPNDSVYMIVAQESEQLHGGFRVYDDDFYKIPALLSKEIMFGYENGKKYSNEVCHDIIDDYGLEYIFSVSSNFLGLELYADDVDRWLKDSAPMVYNDQGHIDAIPIEYYDEDKTEDDA